MRRPRPRTSGTVREAEHEREGILQQPDKVNIPVDLLRTFVAICELGSFTKAAHLFELTQPAVSAHMRRLESIIGCDLIRKNTSGVHLTDFGSEVLTYARRMLSINDQIVSCGGQQANMGVVRLGMPNLFASTKLGKIVKECRGKAGNARIQLCCDHSAGLLRSIRGGYLDLAFIISYDDELQYALRTWREELVWARAPDYVLEPGSAVPLISSPNVLPPDRAAMEALERASMRYEVVFTAFDMLARRAAAASGLGYLAMPRPAISQGLVVEPAGVLPALPGVTMGIIARDDLDTKELTPLIDAFEAALTAPVQ
jgi:DNA-binding transcriptional LysR family regulator